MSFYDKTGREMLVEQMKWALVQHVVTGHLSG
jgi:hypothetical protein